MDQPLMSCQYSAALLQDKEQMPRKRSRLFQQITELALVIVPVMNTVFAARASNKPTNPDKYKERKSCET